MIARSMVLALFATMFVFSAVPVVADDCNTNGALDSLDIAEGTSLDCNVNDVPDECDVEQGTSIDCDSNGLPDECTVDFCPPVDMVVVVDLSVSMTGDGAISALCDDITGIRVAVEALNDSGFPHIDLDVLWIDDNVIADYSGSTGQCPCCNSNGCVAQYGTSVPGLHEDLEECYSREDWGPATAIVAEMRDWTPGAIRLIVPVSDEGPRCGGNPLNAEDYDAIDNAIPFVRRNRVIVSPVIAILNYDRLFDLAAKLATGGAPGGRAVQRDPQDVVNGIMDVLQTARLAACDCNTNGYPDVCDVMEDVNADSNGNLIPDDCVWDDCNTNGISDFLDLLGETSEDCNYNFIPDECDLLYGVSEDCNENLTPDECDIAQGVSGDWNDNLVPDECEDCNSNGVRDPLDIAYGTSEDCNGDDIPEECQPFTDCNSNGVTDTCDISGGTSEDCNANWTPDECEPPIYVDVSATSGLNDGTSWPNAFIDLQDALDETCGMREIWVAAGTYIPSVRLHEDYARSKSFNLTRGAMLYGGFAGNESNREERRPDINETILSGDLDENDGSDFLNNDNNAYNVVYVDSDYGDYVGTPRPVLDGFTVTAGNATSLGWIFGGGLLIIDEGTRFPVVRNCLFTRNSAKAGGGGAYSENPQMEFVNCVFAGNRTFKYNTIPGSGGGLGTDANLSIVNCTFVDNETNGTEGAGVGILRNSNALVSVDNCVFWGNSDANGDSFEAQVYEGTGTVSLNHSCVQNWITGGTHNTAADPLLTDVIGPDYDLKLTSGSPCIDAGDNAAVPTGLTMDRSGKPRFVDDLATYDSGNGTAPIVDMGAYEYADCNTNGVADDLDISGGTSADCNANLTPDECDIANAHSDDFNTNSVPDECEGGACCLLVGQPTCQISLYESCEANGGIFQGQDTTCANGCAYADFDNDTYVDLADFAAFQRCYTGDGYGPIDVNACGQGDFDGDDDLDLFDYEVFALHLEGPPALPMMMSMGVPPAPFMMAAAAEQISAPAPTPQPTPDPATIWTEDEATLTVQLYQVGGSTAVAQLQANTAYEVRYTTNAQMINAFYLGVTTEYATQMPLAIVAPTAGDWSDVDVWDVRYNDELTAAVAFWFSPTDTASTTGRLCTITTGQPGQIQFNVFLDWTDPENQHTITAHQLLELTVY